MKKRILAMFLACMMILSVIAVPAFADEAETECTHENATITPFETETVPATCEETAICKISCPDCPVKYIQYTGKHKPTEVTKNPTCKDPALVYEACEVCGKELSEPEVVEGTTKLEHNFVKVPQKDTTNFIGDSYKDATCLEAGWVFEKCTYCGEEKGQASEALGHNMQVLPESEWAAHNIFLPAPSCDKGGFEVKICTTCPEDSKNVVVSAVGANGHTAAGEGTPVNATCTTPSGMKYTCSVCKAEYVIGWNSVEGNVGENAVPEVPASGHDPEAYSVAGDCDTDKITGATKCKTCGYIDMSGATNHGKQHTIVDDNKDATCSETGITGRKICSKCDYVESEGTEVKIDESKHSKVVDTWLDEPADCVSTGIAKMKCEHCGEAMGYAAVPKGHNHVEDPSQAVAATCKTDGKTVKVCACGDKVVTTISKKAHTPAKEQSLVPATCIAAAYMITKCSVCSTEIEGTETPIADAKPLGHDMVKTIEGVEDGVLEPACGVAAKYIEKCSRCPEKTGIKTLPALEHEAAEDYYEYVEATCAKPNGVELLCKLCGKKYVKYFTEADGKDVYKPAKNHVGTKMTDMPGLAATCQADGYTPYKVCECGTSLYKEAIKSTGAEHVLDLVATLQEADCATGTTGIGKYACIVEGCEANTTKYGVIPATHTFDETGEPMISESKNALYYSCSVCDAVKVYDCFLDGYVASDDHILNNLVVDGAVINVIPSVNGKATLVIEVTGVTESYDSMWVVVNGTVVKANKSGDFVYTTAISNLNKEFEIVVKTEKYGIVSTSAAKTVDFGAIEGEVEIVANKATDKLTGATAKFLNRGVFVGETVKVQYLVQATEADSVKLVIGGDVVVIDLADCTEVDDGVYLVQYELSADKWAVEISATVVNADEDAISNTNYYSVEAYATKYINKGLDDALTAVLRAMLANIPA